MARFQGLSVNEQLSELLAAMGVQRSQRELTIGERAMYETPYDAGWFAKKERPMTPRERAVKMWNDCAGKNLDEMMGVLERNIRDVREECANIAETCPTVKEGMQRNPTAVRDQIAASIRRAWEIGE